MDRYQALARQIVEYSLAVKENELVWIESWDGETELTQALVCSVTEHGAVPQVSRMDHAIQRALLMGLRREGADKLGQLALDEMKHVDSFVSIRPLEGRFDEREIPPQQNVIYALGMSPARRQRMFHTKWCVLRAPDEGAGARCGMEQAEFERYSWQSLLVDYEKMTELAQPLAEDMKHVDEVRIVSPGTDIRFSIRGCKEKPAFINDTGIGRLNLPDGEIGGGVVRESAEGEISYNIPTSYNGLYFGKIHFVFHQGKIIRASCDQPDRQEALDAILDTDDGARYLGEFSLGIHPLITRPIGDKLYDEKMWGSFHLTPGNGNSAVHWDIVQCQREEFGGGEMYWDGKLIRRNGLFIPTEYRPLNPPELIAAITQKEN